MRYGLRFISRETGRETAQSLLGLTVISYSVIISSPLWLEVPFTCSASAELHLQTSLFVILWWCFVSDITSGTDSQVGRHYECGQVCDSVYDTDRHLPAGFGAADDTDSSPVTRGQGFPSPAAPDRRLLPQYTRQEVTAARGLAQGGLSELVLTTPYSLREFTVVWSSFFYNSIEGCSTDFACRLGKRRSKTGIVAPRIVAFR